MSGDAAAIAYLNENYERFSKLARAIWENPEIGLEETFASQAIAAELEQAGFAVEFGAGQMETAFVASWGEGSPIIGAEPAAPDPAPPRRPPHRLERAPHRQARSRSRPMPTPGRPPRHAFGVMQPCDETIYVILTWSKGLQERHAISFVPLIGHFECRDACMERLQAQPAQLRP